MGGSTSVSKTSINTPTVTAGLEGDDGLNVNNLNRSNLTVNQHNSDQGAIAEAFDYAGKSLDQNESILAEVFDLAGKSIQHAQISESNYNDAFQTLANLTSDSVKVVSDKTSKNTDQIFEAISKNNASISGALTEAANADEQIPKNFIYGMLGVVALVGFAIMRGKK